MRGQATSTSFPRGVAGEIAHANEAEARAKKKGAKVTVDVPALLRLVRTVLKRDNETILRLYENAGRDAAMHRLLHDTLFQELDEAIAAVDCVASTMRERAAGVAKKNGHWGTAREIEALALTTHEGTNS